MLGWFIRNWPHVATALTISAAVLASIHALLLKRDVRSTVGWFGVIWLVPFFGPSLYILFGINRIERRAAELRSGAAHYHLPPSVDPTSHDDLSAHFDGAEQPRALARLIDQVTSRALVPGNRIVPLENGDAAYPAMLDAIRGAKRCISLMTFIFDSDPVGLEFVHALSEAQGRGVAVRVLVDAAGVRYKRPHIDKLLRKRKVPVAKFLPVRLTRLPYFNLRNHRKVMVVDGRLGFTGGMNIRQAHLLSRDPKTPTQDVHFRLEGPIVTQLQEVFAEDWEFTTGESLPAVPWFPSLEPAGPSIARGIIDGPDDTLGTLSYVLLGAIANAHHSIRILTPYFLPDSSIAEALNVAALRGVRVDIVLPERGNLPYVQWAMWAQFWQNVGRGVRLWLQAPPFDHGKLMIVDEQWSLFGSTNWDPRSLRLNFEFNVEAYDRELAGRLCALFEAKRERSKPVTAAMLDGRPLPAKLRDALARLLTPYL